MTSPYIAPIPGRYCTCGHNHPRKTRLTRDGWVPRPNTRRSQCESCHCDMWVDATTPR